MDLDLKGAGFSYTFNGYRVLGTKAMRLKKQQQTSVKTAKRGILWSFSHQSRGADL